MAMLPCCYLCNDSKVIICTIIYSSLFPSLTKKGYMVPNEIFKEESVQYSVPVYTMQKETVN